MTRASLHPINHEFVPGGIANRHGDIFGTAPHRVITHGRIIIEAERAGAAIICGWRVVEKVHPTMSQPCDDDFAWLERTLEERDAKAS